MIVLPWHLASSTLASLCQSPQDRSSFIIDFQQDLRCWLNFVNQPYALSGPERQSIYIAIRIRGWCIGAVAHNWATRFRCNHDFTLARSLTSRGSSSRLPCSNGAITQYAVGCLWPTDVE